MQITNSLLSGVCQIYPWKLDVSCLYSLVYVRLTLESWMSVVCILWSMSDLPLKAGCQLFVFSGLCQTYPWMPDVRCLYSLVCIRFTLECHMSVVCIFWSISDLPLNARCQLCIFSGQCQTYPWMQDVSLYSLVHVRHPWKLDVSCLYALVYTMVMSDISLKAGCQYL